MKRSMKSISNARIFPVNQEILGRMFVTTMRETTCREAADDILFTAYSLKLSNYFEIEDEYNKMYPITFKKD